MFVIRSDKCVLTPRLSTTPAIVPYMYMENRYYSCVCFSYVQQWTAVFHMKKKHIFFMFSTLMINMFYTWNACLGAQNTWKACLDTHMKTHEKHVWIHMWKHMKSIFSLHMWKHTKGMFGYTWKVCLWKHSFITQNPCFSCLKLS